MPFYNQEEHRVSKESIIKKRLAKIEKDKSLSEQAVQPRKQQTVAGSIQPPKRRLNRRFIIMLSIWVIALIVALYFLTQR
jgi:hypothetical protein